MIIFLFKFNVLVYFIEVLKNFSYIFMRVIFVSCYFLFSYVCKYHCVFLVVRVIYI